MFKKKNKLLQFLLKQVESIDRQGGHWTITERNLQNLPSPR